MNAVDQVRALVEPGAILELVENTYQPDQNGTRRQVGEKVQRKDYRCTVLDGSRAGQDSWGALPSRVCDVLAVDDTQATFYLDQKVDRLKGHTVTIRRIDEDADERPDFNCPNCGQTFGHEPDCPSPGL